MNQTKRKFLGDDFLLSNGTAVQLYRQFAQPAPVIDFHNHLSPKDIAENRRFNDITEAWLEGDHYKWRAMRANGMPERFCTGSATAWEKFSMWAETVPFTLRNPLYHWTHLELRRYFGIESLLGPSTAMDIFSACNDRLQQPDMNVLGMLKAMKVETVCTTDDPTDSLVYHERFANHGGTLRMFPTFRPDGVLKTKDPASWNRYVDALASSAGRDIGSWGDLVSALHARANFFQSLGCRASDHGLEFIPYFINSRQEAPAIFSMLRSGKEISSDRQHILRSALLLELGEIYHEKGWVQQFHLGAIRNNSSRAMNSLGPDSGFDSIGDFHQIESMRLFFDELDSGDRLAKTIVYNLDPGNNELFAAMAGNFNDGTVPGKMQFGAAWWFLDQKEGIGKQLNALSAMGLLSRFVGMVTDSRSFLSFPRHEYFRRILCDLIGRDVERGELPDDEALLGRLITDICHRNARTYFGF